MPMLDEKQNKMEKDLKKTKISHWALKDLGPLLASWDCYQYYIQIGLNNRNLLLTVMEIGKSNIKVLASVVCDENKLPHFQKVLF